LRPAAAGAIIVSRSACPKETWMKALVSITLGILAVAPPLAALAQTFPLDSVPPSDQELRLRITGKTFHATLSGGDRWHVEYKPGGGFSSKTQYKSDNSEYDDEAGWTTQNGKICRVDLEGATVCNEVRIQGKDTYMQRDDGQIVKIEPDADQKR
jgi:hypothetical protein